jgi:hypothetical protein
MKVTVSRDGVTIGVWERADIKAAVASGELQPTDRYFAQGMQGWRPLSTLTNALSSSQRILRASPLACWQRVATFAGGGLIIAAGFGAIMHPNYLTQALLAAAGFLLVAAASALH